MADSRSRLQRLDAITSTAVRVGFFLIWPVALAVAIGATAFAATHADLLAAMFDNRLLEPQRAVGLSFFVASAAGVALIYAAFFFWWWRQGHWPPGFDRASQIHRHLSFLMSGPAIVALTEPKLEVHHPWRTWLYIALVLVAWWPTLSALSERSRGTQVRSLLSERQRDFLGLGLAFLLWGAYAYFFTRLSITNHHSINTRIVDLGLYNNIFYNSSHGDPLGCSFMRTGNHAAAHFDPILVILSPLHRLWPKPELLLTLQSVWCGAGAVGTYLLGRYQLGSRVWGLVWALAYALHPALHGANLYEFHSLTLLIAPLIFALHFLLSGRIVLYFASLVLLMLIREDVSLLMFFVGLFAIISGEPGLKRAGWVTLIVCVAYFALAKMVFMTSAGIFNEGEGAYGFAYYYKEMMPNNSGEKGFLTTLVTNPAYVAALMTKEAKLGYLVMIFAPLLFLPAWAGRARIMLLYGIVFTLLASRTAVFSPHFQYSAVLLPVAIALAPLGLRRLGVARPATKRLVPAVMGCVLIASLLASWKFGAIVENDSFRGGFRPVKRTWDDTTAQRYDAFLDLIGVIEDDASVSATDQVGAHISSRPKAHRLDHDVETDYFLVHRGDLRGRNKAILDRRKRDGSVELVRHEGVVSLYRRVSPPESE
jgi:uncharacterized membrane protein